MVRRSEFTELVEKQIGSAYVWGGNGEVINSLTVGDIFRMEEENASNTARVLTYIATQIKAGKKPSQLRAFDCSGLVYYCLKSLGLLKADLRACDLQNDKTYAVPLNSLIEGDLVFNKDKSATHVGVYVGNGYVIEARGRDYGVVKRKLSSGSWKAGGRFAWWEDVFVLTRVLKYKTPRMKGDDVATLQRRLVSEGYNIEIDGDFGKATQSAVVSFQKKHGLTVDGIVGKNTASALGFSCEL